MIKVSFEIQVPNLNLFTKYTDYDFLLAHKILDCKEYREFYKKSERYKIVDNSSFELSEPLKLAELLDAAKEVDANEIVIPDIIGDPKASMVLLDECLQKLFRDYSSYFNDGLKIGAVVQGTTIEEWLSYFKLLSSGYPVISRVHIPFALKFVNRDSSTQTQMDSRLLMTSIIDREELYNPYKKYHLLGCSNPIEIKYQSKYKWIDTLDTSSPIQQAVCGKVYDSKYGVIEKNRTKVNFDYKLNEEEIEKALYNIGMLKGWCNGN